MIWKRRSSRAGAAFSKKGLERGIPRESVDRILRHLSSVGLDPDPGFFDSKQLFNKWVEEILSERNPLMENPREKNIRHLLGDIRYSLGFFATKRNDQISSTRELQEGQQLFFTKPAQSRAALAETTILETDETRFVVQEPQRDRLRLQLHEKDTIRVRFSFKDTGYQFETQILSKIQQLDDVVWEVRHVNRVAKLYQRKCPRIELEQEVEYWIIPKDKFYQFNEQTRSQENSPYKMARGVLLDISERGLALSSPVGVSREDFVYLDFAPTQKEDDLHILLFAEVVNHLTLAEDDHIISARIPNTIAREARAQLNQFIRTKLSPDV